MDVPGLRSEESRDPVTFGLTPNAHQEPKSLGPDFRRDDGFRCNP